MATVDELLVLIDATTEGLRRELKRGADSTEKFRKQQERAAARVEQRYRQMARTLKNTVGSLGVVFGAAGIAQGFRSAIRQAQSFEKTLSEVQGLVGLSASEVRGFKAEIRGISEATGRGPQELAEALFFVTSSGLRGKEALEALTVSAKASAAGLGATKDIANAVTAAMNAYGAETLSATKATDILVATVREGQVAAETLSTALGRVIPVAAEMGVSFNDVGAVLAALTRVGASAEESATALRSTLTALLTPGKEAEEALDGVGSSTEELRQIIKDQGLLEALFELRRLFGENEAAIAQVFSNARALTGVLSLIGGNADKVREVFGGVREATGSLDGALGAAADTAEFRMNVAMARLNNTAIELGGATLPALATAFDVFTAAISGAASAIRQLTDEFEDQEAIAAGDLDAIERRLEFLDRRARLPLSFSGDENVAAQAALDIERERNALLAQRARIISRGQIGRSPTRTPPRAAAEGGAGASPTDALREINVSDILSSRNGVAIQAAAAEGIRDLKGRAPLERPDTSAVAQIPVELILRPIDPSERTELQQTIAELREDAQEAMGKFDFLTDEEIERIRNMEDRFEQMGRTVSFTLRTALSNAFLGIETDWRQTIKAMIADWLAQRALLAIGGAIGGPVGAFISGVFGRAHGGGVSRGSPYVVGERGPELFVPSVGGRVQPRMATAAGPSVQVNTTIDARGADPSLLSRLGPALDKRDQQLVARIGMMSRRGQL